MKHTDLIVQHLSTVQAKSVLVIGDVMLDKYVMGAVQRISPEAPIPVLSHSQTSQATGGAANVARNLAQLGCQVTLVGCVGQDPVASELFNVLSHIPQLSFCPVSCADRRTTVKTRYLSSGQQMLRVDS
ncbi:MAG: PfkB family carbohydrate kinase, partial [Pseudomonadota bacterium]|nr:PfkB family carbohydrate kinase [Pseudomonadota bacterium]